MQNPTRTLVSERLVTSETIMATLWPLWSVLTSTGRPVPALSLRDSWPIRKRFAYCFTTEYETQSSFSLITLCGNPFVSKNNFKEDTVFGSYLGKRWKSSGKEKEKRTENIQWKYINNNLTYKLESMQMSASMC